MGHRGGCALGDPMPRWVWQARARPPPPEQPALGQRRRDTSPRLRPPRGQPAAERWPGLRAPSPSCSSKGTDTTRSCMAEELTAAAASRHVGGARCRTVKRQGAPQLAGGLREGGPGGLQRSRRPARPAVDAQAPDEAGARVEVDAHTAAGSRRKPCEPSAEPWSDQGSIWRPCGRSMQHRHTQ